MGLDCPSTRSGNTRVKIRLFFVDPSALLPLIGETIYGSISVECMEQICRRFWKRGGGEKAVLWERLMHEWGYYSLPRFYCIFKQNQFE
jgi:hypothetical protein